MSSAFSSSASRPVTGGVTPNCTFPTAEVRADVLSHGGDAPCHGFRANASDPSCFPGRVVMDASLALIHTAVGLQRSRFSFQSN